MWGDPAEVGKVVGGVAFDVVLDNNGKDLDTVRFVELIIEINLQSRCFWYSYDYIVEVCQLSCLIELEHFDGLPSRSSWTQGNKDHIVCLPPKYSIW